MHPNLSRKNEPTDVPQCPRMSRKSLFSTARICLEMSFVILECSKVFQGVPRRSKKVKNAKRTQTGGASNAGEGLLDGPRTAQEDEA